MSGPRRDREPGGCAIRIAVAARRGREGAAMSTRPEGDTSLTLIERVQRFPPDQKAWDEFVRRYHPMILAWCRKWGLQTSDADDVAQDVLLKLLAVMQR